MRHIQDPVVRADLAAATSDLLHVTAAITGNQELAHVADFYDRAAREPYGRQPRPTPYGSALRTVARALAYSGIGTRLSHSHHLSLTHALSQLIVHIAALVEAVAELRQTQQRIAQAAAARKAAAQLTRLSRTSLRLPSPSWPATRTPHTLTTTLLDSQQPTSPSPSTSSCQPTTHQRPKSATPAPASTRRRGTSR